jgi:hypothetical protein
LGRDEPTNLIECLIAPSIKRLQFLFHLGGLPANVLNSGPQLVDARQVGRSRVPAHD